MVLGGEEGAVCEAIADRSLLEHISACLRFVLGESSTNTIGSSMKGNSGRSVIDVIRCHKL